jgi:tetratricopeptide (TPR) repeat protein
LSTVGAQNNSQQRNLIAHAYATAPDVTLATVIRTCQDFGETKEGAAALRWLDGLVAEARDVTELFRIREALPHPFETVVLREPGVQVARAIVEQLRAARLAGGGEGDIPALARSLADLSIRLSALNRHAEALDVAMEAFGLFTQLAAAGPEVVTANAIYAAILLINLATRFDAIGRQDKSLALTKEAETRLRALVAAGGEDFLPYLAMVLSNSAKPLTQLGKGSEALAKIREAIDIRRKLTAAQPDLYEPALATSLINLSLTAKELARHDEALRAAEEAVSQWRVLAAKQKQYRPHLAQALYTLADNLMSTDDRQNEAMAAAQEAVDIYEELAIVSLAAFGPDLAQLYINVANDRSTFGQNDEALLAAHKAANTYRKLVEQDEKYRPALARLLDNIVKSLIALDRQNEALSVAGEAVEEYRKLAAAQPQAFRVELAQSLATRADCLEAVGQLDEALANTREAIEILLPVFRKSPRDLAMVLNWTSRNAEPFCTGFSRRSMMRSTSCPSGI